VDLKSLCQRFLDGAQRPNARAVMKGTLTRRGKYRSFEEAERMESRRDAIHLSGGLVATAIVLAMIVVGIVVAQ